MAEYEKKEWLYGNTVPVKVTTKVSRKYRREEIVRQFKRHMNTAHNKSVENSKRSLKEAIKLTDSKATGKLLNSVTSKFVSSRASANMVFETEVGFKPPGANYAYWANYGREPGGIPPRQPILDWMKKRGIPESRIFWIRGAIGKYGTKGKHFMELAEKIIRQNMKIAERDAAREFASELRQ